MVIWWAYNFEQAYGLLEWKSDSSLSGSSVCPPYSSLVEAGSNHNGDLGLAKDLIDCAAEAGADAVKFQTFRAENL
jgi:hypothetical protein